MAVNPTTWAEALADTRLPVLAHTKRRLGAALTRPATSHADLGRIIGLDVGLSLALLREVGRSPRAPREPVIGPSRVVGLLGLEVLTHLLRTTPSLEDRYRGPALQGLQGSYGRALHAACFARRLATLRGKSQTEDDGITALLQGLGEQVLWARKPATMGPLSTGLRRPEDLDFEGLRRFGLCPSALGEDLARRWGLAEPVVQVQRPHHSCDTHAQLPLLAGNLAWSGLQDWYSDDMEQLLALAADLTHLDRDRVAAQIYREAAEAARLCHAMGLPHGGYRLLLPDRHDDQARPAAAGPASPQRPAAPMTVATSPPPAASPHPSPLQQNLTRALQEMREALGLERVLLALLTPDRSQIRARIVLEGHPSGLRGFAVSASERNLFSLMLAKPHALWIDHDKRVKYLPHIPGEVTGMIHSAGFFLASIFVRNKPLGLVYADVGDTPPGPAALERFKAHCQRLAGVLGAMTHR